MFTLRNFILFIVLHMANPAFANNIETILTQWHSPSEDYIFVVAHRAAFMEDGQIVLPENSLPAIEYAIELGVDMVELDVRATKDGRFVILHDATVDRTTNGTGKIAELTYQQVQQLRLIEEVTGEVTEHQIPTLEQVYDLVRGNIMVNLDPKLALSELSETLTIAHKMGVLNHIILKGKADTPEQRKAIEELMASLPFSVDFMPMLRDKKISSFDDIKATYTQLTPSAVEMVVGIPDYDDGSYLTKDGGILFSSKTRALNQQFNSHLWMNTLYIDALRGRLDALQWNGGRHDILGLKYPAQVFDFWIAHGATIIQTDEPKFLIHYLQDKQKRKPVTLAN
ncbi:glycerophosphodiester phosphodiesterase family protein [Paraglaciecola aquimarina]|uniref:Glycerophosphodiester phosphodiesterase family protein n=1 Tax=Paraglaciecola aquimarina TaxID=1235557 RepID=A0ABU3T1U4_9ALTE|nr:glycerophosphodiester phosphodiesterase family protein [Paraglaciecola aquimarina]MDU0356216.1 glycerophosphodiester phosphodiesterase family protein [Paraglaciecola aquimarina]